MSNKNKKSWSEVDKKTACIKTALLIVKKQRLWISRATRIMQCVSAAAQNFATQILQSISRLMKNTLNPSSKRNHHILFCRPAYVRDKSLSQPAGYFFPVRGLYKSFQWFAEWGKVHLSASHFPLACHMTPGQVTKQVLKLCKQSSCQTSLASAAGLIAFKQVAVLNCALWSVHLTRYILTALH